MEILTTALVGLLSAVFGAGGIWTWRSARQAAKAKEQAAQTADWQALMEYWQKEVSDLRENAKQLEVRVLLLEERRNEDLRYIDRLEQHIWQRLPPPPPSRTLREES